MHTHRVSDEIGNEMIKFDNKNNINRPQFNTVYIFFLICNISQVIC